MDSAELTEVYVRWWAAVAEPAFVAGLLRARARARPQAPGSGADDAGDACSDMSDGGGGDSGGGAGVRMEAVQLASQALAKYRELLQQRAQPLAMVCDYSIAWLERLG